MKSKEDIIAFVMEHADPKDLGAIGGTIVGKGLVHAAGPLLDEIKKNLPKQ